MGNYNEKLKNTGFLIIKSVFLPFCHFPIFIIDIHFHFLGFHFWGPRGFGRGLDLHCRAKICARELDSVVSRVSQRRNLNATT